MGLFIRDFTSNRNFYIAVQSIGLKSTPDIL